MIGKSGKTHSKKEKKRKKTGKRKIFFKWERISFRSRSNKFWQAHISSTNCRITCISGNHELPLKISELQDWGYSQCQLQPVECLMLHHRPIPLDSSSRQCCQRTYHLAESPHKSSIIRCQTKEATHVMHTL